MLWAERNTPVGAHLLPETKERLRAQAKREGKSMSFIISEAIEFWLDHIITEEGK
jgi:predicted DNA-binding protein